MTSKFDIHVSQDAIRQLEAGNFQDLVLYKTPVTAKGREWTVATKAEALKDPNRVAAKVLAEGAEVGDLLSKVANGESLPADFAPLRRSHVFKELGRVAGLETPEHRLLRENLGVKLKRVKDVFQVIGEGAGKLKKAGKPVRTVQFGYALTELVSHKEYPEISTVARQLADIWKKSDTPLRYTEWRESMKHDWADARAAGQTKLEFFPWLTTREWETREKNAWQLANSGKVFTEADFISWKATQYDPNALLPEPKWLLEIYFSDHNKELVKEKKPEILYDEFIKETIDGRRKYWEKTIINEEGLIPITLVDDAAFKHLDQKAFDYDTKAGSELTFDVFVAKELWKETNPPDQSDQAFVNYVDEQRYAINQKSNPIKMTFEEWKADREQKLEDRWKASLTSLPFKEWKAQQVLNLLVPVPFVSLHGKEREAYKTDCNNGKLERTLDGKLGVFTTTEESTAHSGKGWVIFVVGPNNDLYCGSHLPGVFHHSSFLGDRAVTAAGEIKTDATGKITHISGKSGHYRPSDKENLAILAWFKARGVNLADVEFTCFLPEESEPVNAQDYLDGTAILRAKIK